jgi:hypothetical protein
MQVLVALLMLFLLLLIVSASGEGVEGGSMKDAAWIMSIVLSILLASLPEEFGYEDEDVVNIPRSPCYPLRRERKQVQEIFKELGPTYTRRAYRIRPIPFGICIGCW